MNRHEAIAAMAAAAVAGGAPISLASATDRAAWERVVEAHSAARKRLEAEPDSEGLGELYVVAATEMVATPAPDHPALLYKLEYLFGAEACDPDGESPGYSANWMQSLMSDAHRLLWTGRA